MAKSGVRHADVGDELTKAEWLSEESHELIHGTSFPDSPVERQLFYRDDEHKWYIYNGSEWKEVTAQGASTFLGLTDTPSSYSGQAGKYAKVNSGEDALEFDTPGGGGGSKIEDADQDTKVDVEESADEDKIRMDVAGVEAFLLSSIGVLTLAKQSGFQAYLGTDQTIPTNTATQVNIDTEVFDTQNEFNTTTYRFTATEAGSYLAGVYGNLAGLADGSKLSLYVRKNGVNTGGQGEVHAASDTGVRAALVTLIDLAANDYIEFYVWHNHGSDRTLNAGIGNTIFWAMKIR